MGLLAISQKLLDAASTDETKVQTPDAFARSGCEKTVHVIAWGTGVTAGVVEIEASADDGDTAWATLGTITFSGTAPKTETFMVDGPYGAFQHHISTAVAGGTVTTHIQGVTG